MMKKLQKRLSLLLAAAALSLCFTGCTIPSPGFSDYDVSGYVKALLDSSYHGENENFMSITATTEDKARQNNTDTVENAAVLFCNAYGIAPSEAQLVEFQKVFRSAYQYTRYTVKDEKKTDTGYYLEVEVSPITNFRGRASDIEKLKREAEDAAMEASMAALESSSASSEDEEDEYGEDEDYYDEDEYDEKSSSESSEESSAPPAPVIAPQVDVNTLFVDKVIDFCRGELKSLVYDTPVTITLDVIQTEEGELKLNMDEISVIDKTVVYLSRQ